MRRTGSWLQNKVTKNEEMTMGVCIAFIAVALIAFVAGANYGYTKGEQETNARWTAYLSDKEEEIIRLQKELKETRAAMRILSERKEGRNETGQPII